MNVCRIDVKLNGKKTKSELETISNDIRNSRKEYDKVWISYQREKLNPNLLYDGKLLKSFKKTKTITRDNALIFFKKYIKTNSFKDLYQLNSTLYLPNDKFELLMFGELDNVFSEL